MTIIESTEGTNSSESAKIQFDRALNKMRRNTLDILVAECVNKLGGNVVECLEMTRVLEDIGVVLHTVREGSFERASAEQKTASEGSVDVSDCENDAPDPWIGKFLEAVNDILRHINFDDLYISRNRNDNGTARDCLKQLHDAFTHVYGENPLSSADAEFIEMPAVICGNNGRMCLGLVCLDLSSSGEHWETDFFTPYGVIS